MHCEASLLVVYQKEKNKEPPTIFLVMEVALVNITCGVYIVDQQSAATLSVTF